ncbi:MAG: hypothetical protein QNJ09_00800 [Paracoccaceae bacterium]|nr:hypothetical protein [Paracoccaceae bacterium]
MHITLSPTRHDHRPVFEKDGEALIIDGTRFDFSDLSDGESRAIEDMESDWFVAPATRIDGVLHLTLLLSHGADAPQETLFPEPIHASEDGPLSLPPYEIEEPAPDLD